MKKYLLSKMEREVWRDIQNQYADQKFRPFWEEYHLWKYAMQTKVKKFWKDKL